MKEEIFHRDKNVGITLVKDEKTLKVYSSETDDPVSVINGFFKNPDSKPKVNVTAIEKKMYFTNFNFEFPVYLVKGRDGGVGFRLILSLEDISVKDVHKGRVLQGTTMTEGILDILLKR